MEVLVAEDDAIVSLEEALAFIDGYDTTDFSYSDALGVAGLQIQSSTLDVYSQITPDELLTPKAPSAKPTGTKRSQRQRKESESASSQDENSSKKRRKNKFLPTNGLELNADLGDDGELAMPSDNLKPPSNWHEMAILQYRERLVSEKTNRRLKSILENQEKVNGTLSGLLQKRAVLNFVLSTQPTTEPSLLAADSPTEWADADSKAKILMELEEYVQRLYKKSNTAFRASAKSSAITCDMRIKDDVQRGKVLEFMITTPMSCSVEAASDILWKEVTSCRDFPHKAHNYIKASKPNSYEKNFIVSVRSPSGMLELNGLQYLQKFDEADQTIFVVAERIIHPDKKLHFRNDCWMTVSPSSTDAKGSVVEINYQLYLDRDESSQADPKDISYAQNVVLRSMGMLSESTFRYNKMH
ncbi:unnamed protein product [Phytophthora fragariaefolia]|uniref:Unnamed protein product n=1 Tax=Phytophthora fragariaefolia TaxID=1490495 RepID=A0A9W6YE95_9STRA|nr:unnamed protein product [Phytophthora fragariaefolia]